MTFKDLPSTLTEPPGSLARQIEYFVTNGLGYDSKTLFNSYFYEEKEIKNTKKGLQAHLAQLELHKYVPGIRALYWTLENAPKDHKFLINKKGLLGIGKTKKLYKTLSPEERDKQKKYLVGIVKILEEELRTAKYHAEYPSNKDKFNKELHEVFGSTMLIGILRNYLEKA